MVDLDDRWRRLLADGRVRWLSGMQGVGPGGYLGRVFHGSMQRVGEPPRLNGMEYIWGAGGVSLGEIRSRIVPNWCDPATIGALLGLVREREPLASACGSGGYWEVVVSPMEPPPHRILGLGSTEAEALIAALESM